jgi:hypothetical protein
MWCTARRQKLLKKPLVHGVYNRCRIKLHVIMTSLNHVMWCTAHRQKLLKKPLVHGVYNWCRIKLHVIMASLTSCHLVHCTQAEAAEEAPGAWCV